MLRKFSNRLERATAQRSNHKILHKVGKQWVTIGITCLALTGFGKIATSTNVNASQVTTQPTQVETQARTMHQHLLNNATPKAIRSTQSNRVATNYMNKVRPKVMNQVQTKPWTDPGHANMTLRGTHNFGSVKMNYYSDLQHGNAQGNLLEASGHGLLQKNFMLKKYIPNSMKNDNKKMWRLKVDPGLYMNNSKASFKGTTTNGKFITFRSMDLRGLSTKGVKNFSTMFSSDNDTSNDDPEDPNLRKLNISNIDMSSNRGTTNGMFAGEPIKNLVIGNGFKENVGSSDSDMSGIAQESDASENTFTVPSHFRIFSNSDSEGARSIVEQVSPFLYKDGATKYYKVYNQKKQWIDPATHKSYGYEIRHAIEPAGTYTIVKTPYYYWHKYGLIKEQKSVPAQANRILWHPTKKVLNNLYGLFIQDTYNSDNATNYSYPTNHLSKKNPFTLGLEDKNSSDYIQPELNDAEGMFTDDPIRVNMINNNQYLLGWLVGESHHSIKPFRYYRNAIYHLRAYSKHHSIKPFTYVTGKRHKKIRYVNLSGFLLYHPMKHSRFLNKSLQYKNGYADAVHDGTTSKVIRADVYNKQYRKGWLTGFRESVGNNIHHDNPIFFYNYMLHYIKKHHNAKGVKISIDTNDSDMVYSNDEAITEVKPIKSLKHLTHARYMISRDEA